MCPPCFSNNTFTHPFPSNFKITNCNKYDDTTGPTILIGNYILTVQVASSNDYHVVKHLPLILKGSAWAWLHTLSPNSIWGGGGGRPSCRVHEELLRRRRQPHYIQGHPTHCNKPTYNRPRKNRSKPPVYEPNPEHPANNSMGTHRQHPRQQKDKPGLPVEHTRRHTRNETNAPSHHARAHTHNWAGEPSTLMGRELGQAPVERARRHIPIA